MVVVDPVQHLIQLVLVKETARLESSMKQVRIRTWMRLKRTRRNGDATHHREKSSKTFEQEALVQGKPILSCHVHNRPCYNFNCVVVVIEWWS